MLLLTLLFLPVMAPAPIAAPSPRSNQGLLDLSTQPWVLPPSGEPLAAGEYVAEVSPAGDVIPGQGVVGVPDPLAATVSGLRAADLVLANLECAIAPGNTPCPGQPDEPELQPLPRRLGFGCDSQACYPVEAPEVPEKGLFWTGEIDLTGDGVMERVRRSGRQVSVSRDGVEVWRSPPEWRVADLALGDPNDDGRGELLLAFWKQDTAAVLRSHPFIIGYREGGYRPLWGGSAVSDAIHEVELGDMDGDTVQELIVLEEQGGGLDRAVTVWRWHGWGFSLMWRSSAGRYRDLALTPGGAGQLPTISVAAEP